MHDDDRRRPRSSSAGHQRDRQARARAQEQRVPQGPRGRLARARGPDRPGRAARRAFALARRAATAADPLPRRDLLVVGGAHHRARPQPAALSGKPGAAGVPGGVRTAGAPAGGARRLLWPRAAGRGALGALAYPDRGARAAGRHRRGLHAHRAGRSLVLLAGAVRAHRRPRTLEHARRSLEQGDLRALAGRGRVVRHLRQRAVQPQHPGRYLDVRARHGGRDPDLAAVGLL